MSQKPQFNIKISHNEQSEENASSAQQQNKPGRMTEMGGRQLALKQFQQRKLIKEPSLVSQTGSLVGYTESGSHLSVVSKTSIKSTGSHSALESVRRQSQRMKSWLGFTDSEGVKKRNTNQSGGHYKVQSQTSFAHGLYDDSLFRTDTDLTSEESSEEFLDGNVGSKRLKFMYFFMFIEWLIFCGLVFQGMAFLPDFFAWVFSIEADPNVTTTNVTTTSVTTTSVTTTSVTTTNVTTTNVTTTNVTQT